MLPGAEHVEATLLPVNIVSLVMMDLDNFERIESKKNNATNSKRHFPFSKFGVI